MNHVELLNGTRVQGNTLNESGGGIYTSGDGFGGGDTLLVTNSEISGNSAVRGGGISALNDTVIIQSSTVHGNTATRDGGGLHTGNSFGEGIVRVSDSEFSKNTAVRGGGIYNSGDFLHVLRSVVDENRVVGNFDTPQRGSALGGGIYSANHSATQFFVIESIVSSNSSTVAVNAPESEGAVGGGIYARSGGSFARTAFTGNRAVGGENGQAFGGAIALVAGDMLTSNLTFSGNQSDGDGGAVALFANAGSASLTSTTMTNNQADADMDGVGVGGAIWSESTTPMRLDSTIVAGNFRRTDIPDNVFGEATATSDHNLIGVGDGLSGITNGVNGNQIGTAAEPIDPLIGPLQDNGGPSPTHALLPGSPAIDAGNTSNDTDQRGVDRPDDDSLRDIGAFELVSVHDFGDAPTPYPTTLAENGARHSIGSLYLGQSVDIDVDGVHSPTGMANTDDNSQSPDDEDGVLFVEAVPGFSGRVEVTASAPGLLNAWADMNLSGSWENSETILNNVPVVAGLNVIDFDLPAPSSDGPANFTTITRFRLSSAGNLTPTGEATDGEVEDHVIDIKQIIVPSNFGENGFDFNNLGGPREIEWYDPDIAVGYDYTVNEGGDNFTSVKLPAGFGDDIFTLEFTDGSGTDQSITLNAFEEYDFEDTAQGNTSGGIATFRITGIERSELLDPDDGLAFATGIAFGDVDESGESDIRFTMSPLATPEANNDDYTTDEGVVLNGSSVLANDTDRNEDVLTAELVSGPGDGVLEFNADGTFTYTPDADFFGTDTFAYVANDGVSFSDPATVTITVEQGDGDDEPTVEVIPDPLDPNQTALLVKGTSQDDVIVFKRRRHGHIEVVVNQEILGTFSDIDVVIAYGLVGNDRISVSGHLSVDARLFGNDGNDTLRAGWAGNNVLDGGSGDDVLRGSLFGSSVLVGAAGNDRLFGGILSRDILIGGADADNLYGAVFGRSILIGGTTSHDSDIAALSALQSEWNTRRHPATRIDNLTNGGGLNGDHTLKIGESVQQDQAIDQVFGGWFSDWFFELDHDRLRNVRRNDFVAR